MLSLWSSSWVVLCIIAKCITQGPITTCVVPIMLNRKAVALSLLIINLANFLLSMSILICTQNCNWKSGCRGLAHKYRKIIICTYVGVCLICKPYNIVHKFMITSMTVRRLSTSWIMWPLSWKINLSQWILGYVTQLQFFVFIPNCTCNLPLFPPKSLHVPIFHLAACYSS